MVTGRGKLQYIHEALGQYDIIRCDMRGTLGIFDKFDIGHSLI